MESTVLPADKLASNFDSAVNPLQHRQEPETHSVLTEAALVELKRQALAGCVLCSLEDLDKEDWD